MSTQTFDLTQEVYVNQVLSKLMHVKPLQEGQTAIYRLMGSGKLHPKSKKPINPSGLSLKGKTTVIDRKTRRPVTIMNVAAYIPTELPSGDTKMVPRAQRAVWGKEGILAVNASQPELYAFLERHNANASNEFRDPSRRPLFFRVNRELEREEKMISNDLELEARLLVRDAGPSELKSIAEGFDKNPNMDIGDLRIMLSNMAKQRPLQVIKHSNNKALKRKIFIKEGHDQFLILYQEAEKTWHWNNPDMENTEICRVEVGEDKYEKLAEVLKSPAGRKHERTLHAELQKLGYVKDEYS